MQHLWSSGATEGTALRYLLKFSADTSAWSQRRRWLLVCLWLSIETDSRPVQGVGQTLCEEQMHAHTHTKSLTCSWIRTLWVILTSSPLRCAFSAEQQAITPYSQRFSTVSESLKNAKCATPCPPVPSANCWNACMKLQSWNHLHGGGKDGWRTCFCKCGDSVQHLNWLVLAAAWNSSAAEQQNFRRFTLSQLYLKKKKLFSIFFLADDTKFWNDAYVWNLGPYFCA